MISLIFVAVVCTLTFLYYHKLWNLMEPQTKARQPKLFQFIDDETETESEDLSPEHTLLAQDEKEEEESIFYL